jgi:uncharacterized phiE125 gp8 family phage protein
VYKIITPVATEPVTTEEVKMQLRLDYADHSEENLLTAIIAAAREHGEDITRRAFATQTLEMLLDRFPYHDYIELDKAPLQSITSVKYKDSAGTETTMTASSAYIADTDQIPGRIVLPYGIQWPSFVSYTVNPIRIRYVAGYTTDLPLIFKQAMLMHIGFMYRNRDIAIPLADLEMVNGIYRSRKARWL